MAVLILVLCRKRSQSLESYVWCCENLQIIELQMLFLTVNRTAAIFIPHNLCKCRLPSRAWLIVFVIISFCYWNLFIIVSSLFLSLLPCEVGSCNLNFDGSLIGKDNIIA